MTLDELQKLCDAATEGPWTHHRQQHCPQINCHEIELRTCHGGALYRSTSYGLMEVDGEFICAARTEMPKLIRAMKEARRHIRELASSNSVSELEVLAETDETAEDPDFEGGYDEIIFRSRRALKEIDAILEGEK